MRTAQYFPLVLAAALSFGCGASGIQIQAQSATALRTVNDDAVELIETACEEKSAEAANNANVTTDQAEVDAQAILETCHAIKDAQHAVAASHLAAIAEDEYDLQALILLATAVIRLYGEVVPLAARLDIELPELPPIVNTLTGGGE
jgi:hydroxylamine reductase (hybrid-cluster protein)